MPTMMARFKGTRQIPLTEYYTNLPSTLFLIGAPLTAWKSRPCDRSMWLPGLRTFPDPNRLLSKSWLRCGCFLIFWSSAKSLKSNESGACCPRSKVCG
jgi:hypothetical protein